MLGWLVISLTVVGSGVVAYFYYKLLNYFIRIKFESGDDPFEPETEPSRKSCVRVEDDQTFLFKEINNINMKIHRS